MIDRFASLQPGTKDTTERAEDEITPIRPEALKRHKRNNARNEYCGKRHHPSWYLQYRGTETEVTTVYDLAGRLHINR